jgi:RIC1
MDKGIIIGADYELVTPKSLPFVMVRHATNVRRYLDQILGDSGQHLSSPTYSSITYCNMTWNQGKYMRLSNSPSATSTSCFSLIVILLHTAVELEMVIKDDKSGTPNTASKTLPAVIELLDHFDVALDVVVGALEKRKSRDRGNSLTLLATRKVCSRCVFAVDQNWL